MARNLSIFWLLCALVCPQVLILKVVQALCFDTLLQVLILDAFAAEASVRVEQARNHGALSRCGRDGGCEPRRLVVVFQGNMS
jgi:hypothetical protein